VGASHGALEDNVRLVFFILREVRHTLCCLVHDLDVDMYIYDHTDASLTCRYCGYIFK
jgi:hypothetical protein